MASQANACVQYASSSLPTPCMTVDETALLRLCDVAHHCDAAGDAAGD
jgi:hypothetical protein